MKKRHISLVVMIEIGLSTVIISLCHKCDVNKICVYIHFVNK